MTREEFLKRLHHPIDLKNNGMKVIKPNREEILKRRREEEEQKTINEKVVAVSPFHSEEDEKLFAECAQKSMSLTAELEWKGKRQQTTEEDIER